MSLGRLSLVASILVLPLFCAFADPIKIGSVKTPLYRTEPQRLFVLADFGSQFGPEFGESFQREFLSNAKDCDLEADVSLKTPLDLDEDAHLVKLRAFKPDTVMLINRHGGQVDRNGRQLSMVYSVKLIEVKSGNTTWEAIVDFPRDSTSIPIAQRGRSLAIELANDMKKSQLLLSCKTPIRQPGG